MEQPNRFYAYWGKSQRHGDAYHRLVYHCLDVAAVGRKLALARPRWLQAFSKIVGITPEQLVPTLEYLLAIHDIGKFGHGFQHQRSDLAERLGRNTANLANRPRHDTLGYLLWQELSCLESDHDFGSCWHVEEALLQLEMGGKLVGVERSREALEPWFSAVLGHHGRPPETTAVSLSDGFGIGKPTGPWEDVVEFMQAVRAMLKPPTLRLSSIDVRSAKACFKTSSWWLAGFTVLCDWLGSTEEFFKWEEGIVPLEEYWEQALETAESALTQAGLEAQSVKSFVGFDELFRRHDGLIRPSPLQQAASDMPIGDGPQLFLLEDLTGSGKTEAALTLVARLLDAGKADGFYFALPTMATANAMHARVGGVLSKLFETVPSYVLAHSGPNLVGNKTDILKQSANAGVVEDCEEETSSQAARNWLLDHRQTAILADAGVGTIDQALVGVVRAKRNSLRLLGLHGHVLVVDEVHACDEYMNGLLKSLLRVQAFMGGSAVLLSATLPKKVRQELIDAFREGLGAESVDLSDSAYPCFVHAQRASARVSAVAPREGVGRTVAIEFLHSEEATHDWCVGVASEGRCVAWIRNTVRDALDAYDKLVARLGPEKVTLFHARFPLGDRHVIEQDVVKRFGKDSTSEERAGRVVVSTQVMEQSLDVDFDNMVSDLAPIDRLIQRCGRMQRHWRGDRGVPTLHVFAPDWTESPGSDWPGTGFVGTKMVYQKPSTLWRTQRALKQEGRLVLPARARWLVEAVFGESMDEETSIPSLLLDSDREIKAEADELMQGAMARHNLIGFEAGYCRWGAAWSDDERAPTRLGEPTTVIRLVRRIEGKLVPWCEDATLPRELQWRLGEASVRASQFSGGGDEEEALRKELDALWARVPSHIVPVVMVSKGNDWVGSGYGGKDRKPVSVVCRPGRGLSFV